MICWATAGTVGFKGSRKSTPFAAQRAAETVAERASKVGVREVDVRLRARKRTRERHYWSAVFRPVNQVDRRHHSAATQWLSSPPRNAAFEALMGFWSGRHNLPGGMKMRIRWRGLELPAVCMLIGKLELPLMASSLLSHLNVAWCHCREQSA